MEYRALQLRIEGSIAFVDLLTHEVDLRFLRELEDVTSGLYDEEDVRVVLVGAGGVGFPQAWDADALAFFSKPDDPLAADVFDPFGPLAGLPQPVVTALRGDVISAGLEFALACDIRIAAEGARFAMPETSQGLVPLAGGTQRLPRIAGRGVALAMLLAGEELDAAAALRAGLVSRVVPGDRLAAEASALAESIASRGPLAVRLAKEAVQRGLELTLEQALRYETDLAVLLQTTSDRAEGVRAFFEKRKPRFDGQ